MLIDTLAWWLAIQGVSLVALPVTLLIFDRLPGRGYAFAKPLSLILVGYIFWQALSFHILPNRPASIVWALLPLAFVSAVILVSRGRDMLQSLKAHAGLVIAVEILFAVALFLAAYLRSFIPEIAGTEKPMDLMLLNAADRGRFYPPDDPWLAGFQVSYYYFGYLIQAMLGKLSAVSSPVAFNLGLASTAALAATAAFGLVYEVVRGFGRFSFSGIVLAGLAAVLLVVVIGNLEGALEFGAANGYLSQSLVDWVDIANLESAQRSSACLFGLGGQCLEYPTEESSFWWWWRATRISPDANSITEFPFFSFLLGDLHPHVMAIPFVIIATGLAINFWRLPASLSLALWRSRPGLLLVAAVVIGGLAFINAWDLPTFGFLVAAITLAANFSREQDITKALSGSAGFLLPLALLAGILYLPFYLGFGSQANSIDVELGKGTRPLHSALFWLPLVLVNLPLPLVLLTKPGFRLSGRDVWLALLLPLLVLTLWFGFALIGHGLDAALAAVWLRGWNWLTFAFFSGCLGVTLLALLACLRSRRASPAEADADQLGIADAAPALVLMGTAFLLILGTETFFIDDVFRSRLNTVFKLSYQAWILLGLSGAVSLWWVSREWRTESIGISPFVYGGWAATAAIVLFASFLYPIGATLSRTEGLSKAGRTLEGLAYVSSQNSGDLDAAKWLAQRAGPKERLVEAVLGPYSRAGRISAWSGVPTVLGWPGHENQWGREWALLIQRQEDVTQLYSTTSLEEALTILRKYDVTYVVVGSVERQTYPNAGLKKFEALPVVLAGDTTIYRVPKLPPGPLAVGR